MSTPNTPRYRGVLKIHRALSKDGKSRACVEMGDFADRVFPDDPQAADLRTLLSWQAEE